MEEESKWMNQCPCKYHVTAVRCESPKSQKPIICLFLQFIRDTFATREKGTAISSLKKEISHLFNKLIATTIERTVNGIAIY